MRPRRMERLQQIERPRRVESPHLLTGGGLAFLQPEGNEAVGRVVGRKADRHAITRDHANSESSHPAGQLSRYLMAVLERNLIAATAENFVDATGRLNQIISRQIESILPACNRVETSSTVPDLRLAFVLLRVLLRTIFANIRITNDASPVLKVRAG